MALDASIPILSYATRQLASEVEIEKLVVIALDTVADFGHSECVELLYFDKDKETARVLGKYADGQISTPGDTIAFDDPDMIRILKSRLHGEWLSRDGEQMLGFPLIGSKNNAIGFLRMKSPPGKVGDTQESLILVILTTLIAIAIENAKSHEMATYDGLTGLFVRRHFDQRLREEVMRIRRYGGTVSLQLFDIDHFKRVNDSFGHQQGDIVLRDLAGLLRQVVRHDVDIPCRYGGEELAAILPDTDAEGAATLAERFRQACEAHDFKVDDTVLSVTVSGGISSMDNHHFIDDAELIRRADQTLYAAKESGRNRIRSWEG